MRLLNAKTKRLEEFFEKDIPPYAILSHTWGKDEVLFKDVTKGRYNNDSDKIEGCCREALGSGLDYVWIDTCCIDKRSSAELSEAINSMFDWYERSAVCYAYLADVHDIMDLYVPESTLAFRESKWWTRGWTLQELLAPRLVRFYNASWTQLGEKFFLQAYDDPWPIGSATIEMNGLNGLISEITGIGLGYLDGSDRPCDASTAEKMSWAALRQTTREEDVAYSLLGIFNVNIPLLYGEKARAFHRLQEAIISSSHDQSIFAWGFRQVGSMGNRQLLASSPSDFVGFADVEPYTPDWAGISHYSMTNAGLQISMRLRKVAGSDNTFIGLLNCAKHNEKGSRNIAIALTPCDDGKATMVGQFIRCGTAPISISLSLFQEPDNDPAIPIYIRAGYMTKFSGWMLRRSSVTTIRSFVEAVEVYPPAWQFGADEKKLLDFNRILDRRYLSIVTSGQQTIYLRYLMRTKEAFVIRLKIGSNPRWALEICPSLEFAIAHQEGGLSLAETIMMHKGQMDTALKWEQQLVTNYGILTFRVDKEGSSDWVRPLWILHLALSHYK